MKGLLILILFLLPLIGLTQPYGDTVYISKDGDGDYLSWNNVGFSPASNTLYLMKRGTTDTITEKIIFSNVDNSGIGAWGTGGYADKPVIVTDDPGGVGIVLIRSINNVRLNDFELYPIYKYNNYGIYINGVVTNDIDSIFIENVELHHFDKNLMSEPYNSTISNIYVSNFYSHHANKDGWLLKAIQNLTFTGDSLPWATLLEFGKTSDDWGSIYDGTYTLFHDNNQGWFANQQADGDDGHVTWDNNYNSCSNVLIENFISDRRATGYKANFTLNFYSTDRQDITVRNGIMYPPRTGGGLPSASGAIYMYNAQTVTIENVIVNCDDRLHDVDGQIPAALGQWGAITMNINNAIFHKANTLQIAYPNSATTLKNVIYTYNGLDYAMATYGTTNLYNTQIGQPTGSDLWQSSAGNLNNSDIYEASESLWDAHFSWTHYDTLNYNPTSANDGIDVSLTSDIYGTLYIGLPNFGAIEYVAPGAPIPVADFEADATEVHIGTLITYTDLSTNTPTSWSWSFEGGDPLTSILEAPTVTYNTAGTFNTSLTATNGSGSDIKNKVDYITVFDSTVVADFEGFPLIVYLNDTVEFTDLSTNVPNDWTWSFSPTSITYVNGTNSKSQNPSVRFDAIDSYTVELTALNNYSSDTETKASYIEVIASPPVPVVPDASVASSATDISYTKAYANWTSSVGAKTYLLDVSPNISFSTYVSGYNRKDVGKVKTAVITGLTAETPYYYRVFAFNNVGMSSASNTISFTTLRDLTPPVADFTVDEDSVQIGTMVNFTDLSTNTPISWSWSFEGGTPKSSSAKNPSITYNGEGLFSVELTATNNDGFDTELKELYMFVFDSIPVADFEGDKTSIAPSDTVDFTDLSTNLPVSWLWAVNPTTITYVDGTTSASENPHIRFDSTGSYNVAVQVTNTYGTDTKIRVKYITVTSISPPNPIPDPPVANSTSSISYYYAKANWSASINATSYQLTAGDSLFIYEGIGSAAGGQSVSGGLDPIFTLDHYDVGNTLNYYMVGLTDNEDYYWFVEAVNGAGTSLTSDTLKFTTLELPTDSVLYIKSGINFLKDESGNFIYLTQ